MKKLGLLFGAELLLDTDDEQIGKAAERHLEQMNKDSKELHAFKIKEEMASYE